MTRGLDQVERVFPMSLGWTDEQPSLMRKNTEFLIASVLLQVINAYFH